MADDKSAMLLANAVATNIDKLRRSIDALRQLHDRRKDGNGTFINLIAQLTALKSNLGEMQDWINYAIDDMHEQLLMDLDVLMTSCGKLVRNLDALLHQLRQPAHDNTDWAVKLKFAVESKSMNRLRSVAKRQTDAVNLLLAACKCHTTAQRKILLHKSRQIRKEDASSLAMLVRTSRWNGRAIDALTRISNMIQWFRVLFYIRLFRGTEDIPPTEQEYIDAAAAMRSEAIDRRLEEDATTLRRETKLVLGGRPNSGKELIMRQMKVLYADGYPREERMKYRYAVRATLRTLMVAMIDLIKDTGITLPKELNLDFAILLNEVETVRDNTITPPAIHAVQNLWQSKQFASIYAKNFDIEFPQYTPHFATDIQRIADVDYIPTEADIIRLSFSARGIGELRFPWGELDIHMFNVGGYIPDQFRRRWLHQLEGCTALIYSADICCYDRALNGPGDSTGLAGELSHFESYINAPSFAGSSIILLLNNFTRFKEKLQHSPLSKVFSDYAPSDSDPVTAGRQYLLSRFKALNHKQLSIYSFWVDLDLSENQHLYAALKKTLLHIQQRKARSEVEANSADNSSFARSGFSIGSGTVTRSGTSKSSRSPRSP